MKLNPSDKQLASGVLSLTPKEKYSTSIKLNRYFDMTLSGDYSIAISKKISAGGIKATVYAPFLVISVTEE